MSEREAVEREACEHEVVWGYQTESEPVSLWACQSCKLRFYPACPTCVDVGHRNVVHPLSSPETTPAPDAGLRAAAQRREDAEEARADYEAALHDAWSETGEQPSDEQEEHRGRLGNELAEATLALRAALTALSSPETTPVGVLDESAIDVERLRVIEAAAREYLAHDGSGLGLDADNPWGGDYDGPANFDNLRALRAALGRSGSGGGRG